MLTSAVGIPNQQASTVPARRSFRVHGDQKLQGEGKLDQAKGKVQNAVGGIKDALKGKS